MFNKKWSEMTKAEKIHVCISIILPLIGCAFVYVDVTTHFKYAQLGWGITMALYLGLEAKYHFKENRKHALILLVVGIAVVVFTAISYLL